MEDNERIPARRRLPMRGERADLALICLMTFVGIVRVAADEWSWFWLVVSLGAVWWLVETYRRLRARLTLGPSQLIEYRKLSTDDVRDLADAYQQAADNLRRSIQ